MTPEKQRLSEIPREDYERLIAAVANHEAKALLLAYMASRGRGQYFTSDRLHQDMKALQGGEGGWSQGKGVPFAYCEFSFEPIAAVAKSTVEYPEGRPKTAYSVTAFGDQEAFALSGFVLDWSLKHPDISVQHLLGATQSHTDNRSPLHRVAILESIMTASGDEVSFNQIAADHPELPGIKTITETLKSSSFSKVIDVTTNRHDYNPTLSIIDTEYRGRRPFEMLSNERKAMYEAMHEAGVNRDLISIPLGEFIDLISSLHPELDPRKVRAQLMQGIGPNRSGLPGLKIAENGRGELGSAKSSKVRVKPEFNEAIADFMNGIHDWAAGNNHDQWRMRAREIVENPDDCSTLMKKAFEHSTKARTARISVPMATAVFSLLQQADRPLSVPEIVQAINDDFQISLGSNAVRNHLAKLMSKDKIGKDEITVVEQGRAKKLAHFSFRE